MVEGSSIPRELRRTLEGELEMGMGPLVPLAKARVPPGSPSKLKMHGTPGIVAVVAALSGSIYVPSTLFGLADGVILSTVPLLARSLHCSDTVVGLMSSARHLGKIVADVPAGNYHRQHGAKASMQLGLLGLAVLAVLSWHSTGIVTLYISLLLSGCCEALFTVSRGSFMRNRIMNCHRGRVNSLLAGINRITRAVAPMLGGWFSIYLGTGAPMLLRALFGAIGCLLLMQRPGTSMAEAFAPAAVVGAVRGGGSGGGSHSCGSTLQTLWAFRAEFGTGGVAAFMLMVLRSARNVVIPLKGDNMDADVIEIGYAFTAGYVVDSMLFIPVGWAMDKYGRKVAGVPAFVILAVGLALVPTVSTTYGLVVVSVIMGFGNGLSSGLNQTLGSDLSPTGNKTGNFMGTWALICDLGALLGPIMLGAVSEARGLELSCMSTASLGVVGALWLGLFTRETLRVRVRVRVPRHGSDPGSAGRSALHRV